MIPNMETLKNISTEIRNKMWKPTIISIILICPVNNQYDKVKIEQDEYLKRDKMHYFQMI